MTVYLDYASHTPVSAAVLDAFLQTEKDYVGNPLSAHGAGYMAKQEFSRVTQSIAEMLHVKPAEIIFTSGATEANNLAINGIARGYGYKGRHILSTCLEHPSVGGVLGALQEDGFEVELLRILPDGTIDLGHLESAIRPDTILVCVSSVDSEIGAIQPIADISTIVARHSHCHLHVDGAQAMGKLPVCMHNASTLSFSAHKFYGLCGCGVLVKREGVVLEPLIRGGAGMSLYRSGTPALGLAVACCKALELAVGQQDKWIETVKRMREYLLAALGADDKSASIAIPPLNGLDRAEKRYPLLRINSPTAGSPYILNLSVKGIKAHSFVAELDRHGVCVSVKSACSTDNSPSRAVMAVSDRQNALCSWRVSFSHLTEAAELNAFMLAFDKCYKGIAGQFK